MKAKYTPGPWAMKFQPGKLGMVYVDAQTAFVAPPGAVNVADARLIAAAPEQYELLIDALDLVPRISDDDPMAPALAEWCHKARAAIRKATGQQT